MYRIRTVKRIRAIYITNVIQYSHQQLLYEQKEVVPMPKNQQQPIQLSINKNIFNDSFYPLLFDYNKRWEVYKGSA